MVGTGDLTQLNIKRGDDGGELDPHGADRKGNPIGGLVFTKAFSPNRDTYQQIMGEFECSSPFGAYGYIRQASQTLTTHSHI